MKIEVKSLIEWFADFMQGIIDRKQREIQEMLIGANRNDAHILAKLSEREFSVWEKGKIRGD